ncbi:MULTISPECIES: type I-E CRISPR-associated protein Cse2/CasB [unclassified Streptomyces]|uniref:type I-E CRISPR-associated protein Cse2/CasB n=1 Tax=unclassified Streptomyces TaxID=2593676 RepID=UPI00225481ED|nr:type I-E CRISPR-associated protein Cse2/CasB [Streptomyces sp. NBC_00893]MCX4851861.1 type I-E CRISPR-associated protein Cse2/CasB [Streptomyces sp. NBC_00893]
MTTTPPPTAGDITSPPDTAAGKIPQQNSTPRAGRSRTYTNWVERICREDAGARSALRSGLRKDLDSVQRMHRLVAPWLPDSCPADVERAYYTVAAMIAAQPRSTLAAPDHTATDPVQPDEQEPSPSTRWQRTSLGTAFATAVTEGPGREKEMRAGTAESRLNLLTRQSVNGLHRHLPASVGYLRSLGVDVDWAQLLDDISLWRHRSGRISRTWLQDFYRLRDKAAAQQADDADEQELSADPAPAPTSP